MLTNKPTMPLANGLTGCAALLAIAVGAGSALAQESTPYQARLFPIECTPATQRCQGVFPEVAPGTRLDIQFVSCYFTGSLELEVGLLQIGDARARFLHHLPQVRLTTFGAATYAVASPIVLSIGARRSPAVFTRFTSAVVNQAECDISGELVTLP
jgi:hypothetical protein